MIFQCIFDLFQFASYRLQECILVFVTFLDVDMRVAVCHYIIKNIAGQFCAVVEEECNALLLGTKDGKPVFVPPPPFPPNFGTRMVQLLWLQTSDPRVCGSSH